MLNNETSLNFSQQDKLFDPDASRKVHLIGAGSVGSLVASALARIGVSDITVWDDDSIDSHNVGPSLYGRYDFGKYKVDALKEIIERDTGLRIATQRKLYQGEPLKGSIVCCVDSMEARQSIWSVVKKNLFVDILIDTRTAGRFSQIFTVRPCNTQDIEGYEPFLAYGTEEASRQTCGMHSIIFIASRVAANAVESLSGFWLSDRTEFVRMEQLGSDMFIHPKEN